MARIVYEDCDSCALNPLGAERCYWCGRQLGEGQYAPGRLPGMGDVATDEQGLLWADCESKGRAAQRPKPEPENPEQTRMFEGEPPNDD